MDIGFDQNTWTRAPAAQRMPGASSQPPEWRVLLARFDACLSARREMMANGEHSATRRGSFDRAASLRLAGFEHASCAVNPTALANRKPDGGIAVRLAGHFSSGTRG